MTRSADSGAPYDDASPGFEGRPDYRSVHLGAVKAEDYDRDFHDLRTAKGVHWRLEQRLLRQVLANVIRIRPGVAVDFACGTGRVLQFLESRVDRSVGVDVSPDMLAIARERCPRSEFLLGDVTRGEATLEDESVDLVTAFRFFLNAEPALRLEALAWIRSVLKPDGWLVANFHLNPYSVRGRYLRLRWRGRRRTPMMSPAEASRLFSGAGFEVVTALGYDLLPYRRDGSRWRLPRLRAGMESVLTGRAGLARIHGSFILVARPRTSTGAGH
jgi:SAM-dependent methyltransferase